MPSAALGKFEGAMMKDVDRIIATHVSMQGGGKGNKGLGHLTRAGVLLLCAAWELYVEELLIEAIEASIDRSASPDELPATVKRTISDYIRGAKHQLKPLAMAGDGWKTIYLEIGREWVVGLNTPKHHNVDEGYHRLLGIDKLSDNWSIGAAAVDDFVSARGDVAHKGSDVASIHMNVLKETYKPQICRCAIETDNAVSTFIRETFAIKTFPWNRRALA